MNDAKALARRFHYSKAGKLIEAGVITFLISIIFILIFDAFWVQKSEKTFVFDEKRPYLAYNFDQLKSEFYSEPYEELSYNFSLQDEYIELEGIISNVSYDNRIISFKSSKLNFHVYCDTAYIEDYNYIYTSADCGRKIKIQGVIRFKVYDGYVVWVTNIS